MKRYTDCIMQNSECRKCSLSSYERDCHNNPAHPLAYYRGLKGMSQQRLADESGVIRQQIARYETDERDLAGAQVKTVIKLARVLGVAVEDLVGE